MSFNHDNDILISAIRYAKSRNGESITVQDLMEYLNREFDTKLTERSHLTLYIYGEIIQVQGGDIASNTAYGRLKSEAHFHLIEYDAMNSANELARKALSRSTISIWIAIVAMIIGIWVEVKY